MEEKKLEFYKSLGLKLTPQRIAILEYLEGNKTHPSAEDIYNALKQNFPSMSFATVYNTLEVLVKKGLIKEIIVDPYKKRFDAFTHNHHHFVCKYCKKVIDVSQKIQFSLPNELKGCEVEDFQVVFIGVCPECKAKEN
ncbi:transcriptional repressor [Thermodesulfobacterium sp. TA1]|uniref:Fur family transcriptional regulator n=1 Tax=Thermodesulfobacterium sp. TA1 TaxID=2234087 RepID=UPI0012320EFB|nr:transcriptional repressor [Thermodesulfobacterium sp. TA1]QER41636.1 transcriptional repressor [Thermodesulfobacterium sp. TA1]